MVLYLITLIFFFHSSIILAQSIPESQFSYQLKRVGYDAGMDWESLTIFTPIRFNVKSKEELKKLHSFTNVNRHIGFHTINDIHSLYGFGRVQYKNHYYAYVYPKISNNQYENNSGLGFENTWVLLQISSGKESWGAGNDIQLALSDNSDNYDYLLIGSDYGKLRVRYLHGFLETLSENFNRYITARGIEWTNKKSFVIGLSETVIYSGKNRAFDIGYLNPISSHLEIELNDRLNIVGNQNSNAVWQIHFDYFFQKKYRISGNYLYDELVLDKNIEINKENGKAFSFRIAYSPILKNNHFFTLHCSFVHIGTPTFRHKNGTNNFVQNNKPLGWYRGSDSQELSVGVNYLNNEDFLISLSTGFYQIGEETITSRVYEPYKDYLKGSFPSGQVDKSNYTKISYHHYFESNLALSSKICISQSNRRFELAITADF